MQALPVFVSHEYTEFSYLNMLKHQIPFLNSIPCLLILLPGKTEAFEDECWAKSKPVHDYTTLEKYSVKVEHL